MAKPCQSQSVQVSEQHYPNGVYSCHQKGFTAAYDQGCVVEFSSVGLVLSAQESQQLAKADDPTVPEGFIAVMHRSVVWNPFFLSGIKISYNTNTCAAIGRSGVFVWFVFFHFP